LNYIGRNFLLGKMFNEDFYLPLYLPLCLYGSSGGPQRLSCLWPTWMVKVFAPWPPPGKGRHMGPLAASAGRQLAWKRAPLNSSQSWVENTNMTDGISSLYRRHRWRHFALVSIKSML
jgi:hypothetical protein